MVSLRSYTTGKESGNSQQNDRLQAVLFPLDRGSVRGGERVGRASHNGTAVALSNNGAGME